VRPRRLLRGLCRWAIVSWAAYLLAACPWFVYGVRKHDKTIYLACIGWILLDVAIVIGAFIYS
jgi:hypothetical protein